MSIIGISGQIGSGKDTVGKMIQYLQCYNTGEITIEDVLNNPEHEWWVEEQSKWEIKKFAGKLKQIASLLTGIPVEKFEDQEFKKTFLSSEWGTIKNNPLNAIPVFESIQFSELMSVREFLQKLGTEAMRNGLHVNTWVNALFADYKEHKPPKGDTFDYIHTKCIDCKKSFYGYKRQFICNDCYDRHNWYPNWIITDMRFPNEMEAIVARGGITIRVVRPHGYINPHTGEYKEIPLSHHSSETALDESEFDYEILNDGTIADLVEKVKEILIKENII